jgi:glycosyltransferase involved in cell wall biosynthesis
VKIPLSAVIPIAPNFSDSSAILQWISDAINQNIFCIIVRDSFSDNSRREFDDAFHSLLKSDYLWIIDGKYNSPGLARNAGILSSRSEWIVFWDCDDLPNPMDILKEIECADSKVECIVGQYKVNAVNRNTRDLLDVSINPGIWRIAFRRSWLSNNLFSDYMWGEDQLFIIESRFFDANISLSEKYFYDYKVGAETQLTKDSTKAQDLRHVLSRAEILLSRPNQGSSRQTPYIIMMIRMGITLTKRSIGWKRLSSLAFFTVLTFRLLFRCRSQFLYSLCVLFSRIVKKR